MHGSGAASQCVRNSDVETSPDMTGSVVSKQAIPAAPLTILQSDNEGLRTHLTNIDIPAALLCCFRHRSSLQVVSQHAICDEVHYVNMLVDYTKTTCIPVGASNDTFNFLVLSNEPIFSVKLEESLTACGGAFHRQSHERSA